MLRTMHSRFTLLGVLSYLKWSQSEPQVLNLYAFDSTNSDPDAVCNDGTRGGYYFSKAIDPSQENVFVVHLPGGGQCYDQVSCDERAESYKSFNFTTPTLSVTGYLDASPDRTPLWGANKAYLVYCSSDGYMGDAPASNATWGYHFRGQRLVHSLFQALTLNHGFNQSKTVYLTGSSAGARGTMVHIDQLVKDYIPSTASVIGLLDSPYYLDVPPYSSLSPGFQYQEQQKYKYFSTLAILSPECIAAYPQTSDQWKCQFGEYRMPFVKTSYFLISAQFDSYQLNELTRATLDVYTPEITAYATEFGVHDRASLQNLQQSVAPAPPPRPVAHVHSSGHSDARGSKTHPFIRTGFFPPPASEDPKALPNPRSIRGYGYYSTGCYNHAVGTSDLFYKTATYNKTILRDAFSEYLSHHTTALNLLEARKERMERPLDSFQQEYKGKRPRRQTRESPEQVRKSEKEELTHAVENESDKTSAWSAAWIDTCTSFQCGMYCNGIV